MKTKKILLIVCSVLLMMMLTACGSKTAGVGDELSYNEVYSMAEDYLTYLQNFTDKADYEDMKDSDFLALADTEDIAEATDISILKTAVASYTDSLDDFGTFESVDYDKSEISHDEDSMTVVLDVVYSKHSAKLQLVFDKDMQLTSMTIDAVLKTNEIFVKALINTLLGMGTVFVVLILISFIISGFKLINKAQNKSKNKGSKKVEEIKDTPVVEVDEPEEEADDGELVAVIAAAIAAAEGTSTDGFVVRSIRRSKNSSWKRA